MSNNCDSLLQIIQERQNRIGKLSLQSHSQETTNELKILNYMKALELYVQFGCENNKMISKIKNDLNQ